MLISIIIPCYNSTEILEKQVSLIIDIIISLKKYKFEIILVNDCSPSIETLSRLLLLHEKYNCVKVIDLAKNTGQANAQMAALNYALGDIIINMDDDMQTHPENIPILLAKLEEGYDVVVAKYELKRHSWFRRLLTKMCDIFDKICLKRPAHLDFTSFWAMKKYVRDIIIQYQHPYSYMEGLILRTTHNIANVQVTHYERQQGESGYNFWSLLKLWSNFTNFSIAPLRISGVVGVLVAIIAFIVMLITVIRKIIYPEILMGYTSIICIMLFCFGVVLISIWMLGEYIGRIFMCVNLSPQYTVKEIYEKTEQ